MNRKTLCTVGLVLAFVVTPLPAEVRIGLDENADFSAYHTYAWREGTPAANPKAQQWIVAAVDAELQGKGLRKVESDADIYVSTVAYGEIDTVLRGNYVQMNSWGVITSHVEDKTTGNLIVDLIDPSKDDPVWRGVAKEAFQLNKLAKAEKKIEKIVKKMFKDFPPS